MTEKAPNQNNNKECYIDQNEILPTSIEELKNFNITKLIAIAKNPGISSEMLDHLSNHSKHFVRLAVAKNPKTSNDTIKFLSLDKSKAVREGVCRNPSTPVEILKLALEDSCHNVRAAASKQLSNIAKSENTSVDILVQIAEVNIASIRLDVSQNPNTDLNTLEKKLSRDIEPKVRGSVARNKKISLETIERLSTDTHIKVKTGVAMNEKTPSSLLRKLLDSVKNNSSVDEYTLKINIAEHPNVTDEILQKLLNDESTENYVKRMLKRKRESFDIL